MRKLKEKIEWFLIEEMPSVPVYLMEPAIYGFTRDIKKYCNFKMKYGIYYFNRGNFWFYHEKKEWKKRGKEVFEKIKKDKHFMNFLLKNLDLYSKQLFKECNKLDKKDFSKCSEKELLVFYKKMHKPYSKLWSLGMVQNLPDFENDLINKELLSWVKTKNLNSKKPVTETASELMAPEKKSFTQIQELSLLKLYSLLKEKKGIKKVFLKNKPEKIKTVLKEKFQKEFKKINAFSKENAWINYGWKGSAPAMETWIEKIKELFKDNFNEKQNTKELKEYEKNVSKTRNQLLKELKPSNEMKKLVFFVHNIARLKNARMDSSFHFYFLADKIFKVLCKRKQISLNQIKALRYEDLMDLSKGKISTEKINKQHHNALILNFNSKESFFYGKKAKQKKETLLKELKKHRKKNVLNGTPAYPGKVLGKAKIINSKKDFEKFRKGDILISIATSPDMVPLIKKASAILTDMGGVTCHAAIVSRELRVPCVIALKRVTKNFNDGDLLEVNATHGVVKKIEKKE